MNVEDRTISNYRFRLFDEDRLLVDEPELLLLLLDLVTLELPLLLLLEDERTVDDDEFEFEEDLVTVARLRLFPEDVERC